MGPLNSATNTFPGGAVAYGQGHILKKFVLERTLQKGGTVCVKTVVFRMRVGLVGLICGQRKVPGGMWQGRHMI